MLKEVNNKLMVGEILFLITKLVLNCNLIINRNIIMRHRHLLDLCMGPQYHEDHFYTKRVKYNVDLRSKPPTNSKYHDLGTAILLYLLKGTLELSLWGLVIS